MAQDNITAPFSFHCTICIEPFDLTHRLPVILPCGHTYLCEPCSKRLKRCMECRISLFIKIPSTTQNNNHHPNSFHSQSPGGAPISPSPIFRRSYATPRGQLQQQLQQQHNGYNTHNGMSPKPKKPPATELMPLPIAKNLLMISLMEAAERRRNAASANLIDDNDSDMEDENDNTHNNNGSSSSKNYNRKNMASAFEDEDEDDARQVLSGIDAMSSHAGTYVVREKSGLNILDTDPNVFALRKIPSSLKAKNHLLYRQKVQVVSIEDGVYKLARNYGFILANDSQLVKVGMPTEKACEVEGMISTIRTTKSNLEKQVEELNRAEMNLLTKLCKVLDTPEEHPVIEEYHEPTSSIDETKENALGSFNLSSSATDDHHQSLMSSDMSMNLPKTPTPASPTSMLTSTPTGQVLFLEDEREISLVISNDNDAEGVETTQPFSMIGYNESPLTRVMCGESFFFPILRRSADNESHEESSEPRHDSSSFDDLPTAPTGIDYRTGLSGHGALNVFRRKHSNVHRHEIRMMSDHRGIAPIRQMRKQQASPKSIGPKKTW